MPVNIPKSDGSYDEYSNGDITALLQPLAADPNIAVIIPAQPVGKRELCAALLAATDSTARRTPPNHIIIPISSPGHFCGLYLARSSSGDYSATYINPTGREPEEDERPLIQAIAPFIEGDIRYSSTALQHGNNHGGAFTSFILRELATGKMTFTPDGSHPSGVTLQWDVREMPNLSEDEAGIEASDRLGLSIRGLHAELISGRDDAVEPLRTAIVGAIDSSIELAAKRRPVLDLSSHSAGRVSSTARAGSSETDGGTAPRASILSATARVVGGDEAVSYSIDKNGKTEFHLHKDRVEGMVTGGGRGMGSHTTTYASILEAACFSCVASDPMDIPRRIQAIGSLFSGYDSGNVDKAVEELTRSEEAKQELLEGRGYDDERSQIIKRGAAVTVAEYITERAKALLVAINTSKNIAFGGSGVLGKSQGGIVGAEIPKIALLRTFLDLKDEVSKHNAITEDGDDKTKSALRIARLVERLDPVENASDLEKIGITCAASGDAVSRAEGMIASFEERWRGKASIASLMLPIMANTFDYAQTRHGTVKGIEIDSVKEDLSEICATHLALVSLACGLDRLNHATRQEIATEFLTKAILTERVERREGAVKITQGWQAQSGLTAASDRQDWMELVIERYEDKMNQVNEIMRGTRVAAAAPSAPDMSLAAPPVPPAAAPATPPATSPRMATAGRADQLGVAPAGLGGRGVP